MRLDFSITNLPKERKGYHLITDMIGAVSVQNSISGEILLEQILVAEFALDCREWLEENRDSNHTDFSYVSMDEEEEPLLAFRLQTSGLYLINSCWSENVISDVSASDLQHAISKFLKEFADFVRKELQIDFSSFVELRET